MTKFKRKPKIIKGHSLNDYLNRYGKGYITCKNEVIDNPKKLNPKHRYYEINGKYYQIDRSRWLRNTLIALGSISLVTSIYLPIHFLVIAPKERYHDYAFKYWNKCKSLDNLKDFVRSSVTPGNKDYVPKQDRIATFDMDGTLYGERSPIYIEWLAYKDYCDKYWKDAMDTTVEVTYDDDTTKIKTLQDTYDEILAFIDGTESPELEMDEAYCGAKVFSNISISQYTQYVESYLNKPATNFNNLLYRDMVYKPMIEVVEYLQQNNFNVYIVSATDRFMIRTIVNHYFNIPATNILGMDVKLEPDAVTGEMIRQDKLRYKNGKKVKTELITREIGKSPILSFGNSSGDVDMHNLALRNPNYHSLAFMNVANDQERERGYSPEVIKERIKTWDRFQLFSMKDDWKTIYGDDVTLKK